MTWRDKAAQIKRNLIILYQASCDQRLPWYIRVLPWLVLAYALSPIDLIPDFIPILGYLDDLLLLPLGIILALKLIPAAYKKEYQEKATQVTLPGTKTGIIIVLLIWLGLLAWLIISWLN